MFRQFMKALDPFRNKLARAAGGGTGEAAGGGGAPGPASGQVVGPGSGVYARNCVSKEQQLSAALRQALPGTTYISVQDISGGCGAMFEISIEAKEFAGLSRVKQHRLVTDCLRAEIAQMHGLRIHTATPEHDPPR